MSQPRKFSRRTGLSTAPALGLLLLAGSGGPVLGAELTTLYARNFADFAPTGKKADAIFGDYVLRNDRIVAVVADPDLWVGRSGSRKGGEQFYGRLIDLTTRDKPNDLLDLFDPMRAGPQLRQINQARGRDGASKQEDFPDEALAWRLPGRQLVTRPVVELRIPFLDAGNKEVVYRLEDGKPYLEIQRPDHGITSDPSGGGGGLLSLGRYPQGDPNALLSGTDPSGKFYWVYDPWFGQAYGVYSPEYRLNRADHLSTQGNDLLRLTPPEQTIKQTGGTITQWLIPGTDLFEVRARLNEALGERLLPVRIAVTDPDGAVAGAEVRLLRAGVIYAVGRTDTAGEIRTQLPSELFEMIVTPAARPPQKLTFEPARKPEVDVTCPRAAVLVLKAVDQDGQAIPCKVEMRGREQTPDPYFGPDTAEFGVRNLIYTADGAVRRPVPPGLYDLLVSHGPEYEAHVGVVTLTAGQDTAVDVRLERVVDSRGWVSVNFENRTSVSRFQSNSSAVGRVLNLLAEGVEFAPATDFDHINDLSPAVAALHAQSLLATCPGARMTWSGRKYAQRFHVSFPLPYVKGRQDGGLLQRPQHVMLRTWLERWKTEGDKLITIDEPPVRRVFMKDLNGDGEPDVGYGNEVIDVHDLRRAWSRMKPTEPPSPRDGAPLRLLDWLNALRLGYRTVAIASSDEADNWHANARQRTYVRFDDADLAKLDPRALGKAIRQGACVVSTGPLLVVEAITDATGAGKPAQIGDTAVSRNGQVQLHVSVQAPSWMSIDRIDVLVNSRPATGLSFTRAEHGDMFSAAPRPFDRVIPVTIREDSCFVVVASGSSLNLGRRTREASQERQPQVAVSNAVRIDLGGNGFQPSPMQPMSSLVLGGSENEGVIRTLRPISARAGDQPGRFQMMMANRTSGTARGSLSFEVNPPDGIRFLPLEERTFEASVPQYQGGSKPRKVQACTMSNNQLKYELDAGQTIYVEFEAALEPGRTPGGFWLFVPRQEQPVQRTPVGQFIEVEGYTAPLLPRLSTLAQFDEMLPAQTLYLLRTGAGKEVGQVKLGVTGSALVVDARLSKPDPSPEAGTRHSGGTGEHQLTVFLTNSPKLELREYDPFYREQPPLNLCAYTVAWDDTGSAPRLILPEGVSGGVTHKLTVDRDGYRVQMLIPYTTAKFNPPRKGESFLMEVQAQQTVPGAQPRVSTVFGAVGPGRDARQTNVMYGKVQVQ